MKTASARASRTSWFPISLLSILLLLLAPAACGDDPGNTDQPDSGLLSDAGPSGADAGDAGVPAGADAGAPDSGTLKPFPPSPAIFISAFGVSPTGKAADGDEGWVDLRIANAAGLSALGGWSLSSASFSAVQLQLVSGEIDFPLEDGDVLRVHGVDYTGTTDINKEDNNASLWDVVSVEPSVPSFKHGLLWLEAGNGEILDAVFYVTGANDGSDWLTGPAMTAAQDVVAAGQWNSTVLAAAVKLEDREKEWGRVDPVLHRAGNSANDWQVVGQTFETYYAAAEGKTGEELKAALHDIIDDHDVVSYSSAITAFLKTDPDPNQPGNVIDFYTGQSLSTGYNREHVWAKSHGGFDGIAPAYSDLHHLRPTKIDINSVRWHLDFAEGGVPYKDTGCKVAKDLSFEPLEGKGEVARTLFYMAVRYSGDEPRIPDLELVEDIPSLLNAQGVPDNYNHAKTPTMGKLSQMLQWHIDDPPSEAERKRNDVIQKDYQGNRNPFVDHPEWVAEIFGGPAWPH